MGAVVGVVQLLQHTCSTSTPSIALTRFQMASTVAVSAATT